MITYVDSENKQKYTVLFEKASVKLGLLPIIEEERDPENHEIIKHYSKMVQDGEGKWIRVDCAAGEVDENTDSLLDSNGKPIAPITTLNEYFQHIKELSGLAIGEGRSGSDPYFLRLPLDEPFFEINANTRGITVPGELSQIAVRGDKLAEIVFFRIDRYYDAVDLNTRHIYIEWELPDGTKGISRDFLRDAQSEKDKLIFGWAIGEELTKQVGTIRFAVRFVEWFDVAEGGVNDRNESIDKAQSGTQMLYSFSSLPATVSVVESLNYSLFEDDEALKLYNTLITDENIGTITLYLENSDSDSADSTGPDPSAPPFFVRDLTKDFYTNAVGPDAETGEYRINLVDGKLELLVEANAADNGHISYVFGRIAHTDNEGTGVASTGAAGIVAKTKFIPTTDTFDSTGSSGLDKTYYIYDSRYQTYLVADEDALANAEEGSVFERVAYTEVALPGHYYAIADNIASGMKVNSTHSSVLYVPWASAPVVNEALPARFVSNEQEYELVVDESFNQAALSNRDKTNVRVLATAVPGIGAEVTLIPNVSATDTAGLTYVWYRHPDNHLMDGGSINNAEEYSRPEGLRDDEWAEQEANFLSRQGWSVVEETEGLTFVTNENGVKCLKVDGTRYPGCYAVKVINDFNNDTRATDLLDAGVCRVTTMPRIPTINWRAFEEEAIYHIPSGVEVSLDGVDYDTIEYQWHRVTYDVNDDLEIATETTINPASGVLHFDSEGKAMVPFVPGQTGNYFLELKNTLNGATVIYNSAEEVPTGIIIQISLDN